jgi:kynurenine formamidase
MPIIDLSHVIRAGMLPYPGIPGPSFGAVRTHADTGGYSPGTSFHIGTYSLAGNTGTYVDAPFHRFPTGADLAALPLERLVNLAGIIIEAAADGQIDDEVFDASACAGRAVLFRTGWSRKWGTEGYFRSGPFLARRTCEMLVEAGAVLVGIDCANIDNMTDPARPAHTVLLGAGIPVVEHLRGLELLSAQPFRFSAAPPALEGGTSFPVRAFAIVS